MLNSEDCAATLSHEASADGLCSHDMSSQSIPENGLCLPVGHWVRWNVSFTLEMRNAQSSLLRDAFHRKGAFTQVLVSTLKTVGSLAMQNVSLHGRGLLCLADGWRPWWLVPWALYQAAVLPAAAVSRRDAHGADATHTHIHYQDFLSVCIFISGAVWFSEYNAVVFLSHDTQGIPWASGGLVQMLGSHRKLLSGPALVTMLVVFASWRMVCRVICTCVTSEIEFGSRVSDMEKLRPEGLGELPWFTYVAS